MEKRVEPMPKWQKLIIIIALLTLSLLSLSACGGQPEPVPAAPEPIDIVAQEQIEGLEPDGSESLITGDNSVENPINEEQILVVWPHPFDNTETVEAYRLVSSNSAIAPNGIYIIDLRRNLYFISDTNSENMAEQVTSIVGITPEWLYYMVTSQANVNNTSDSHSLVRISLTDNRTQEILENINFAIYNSAQDIIYYYTRPNNDVIELHAFNMATGQNNLIYTDEGVLDVWENELVYALYGWFELQSDGTVAFALAYPYPSEVPYVRYLRIDGYEITADSEKAPWAVEFSSFDMEQNRILYYKGRWETRLTQIRYGVDKRLVRETLGNPPRNNVLFYEQNEERKQVAQSNWWLFNFAYYSDRVYYRTDDNLYIYDLISKERMVSTQENIRTFLPLNDKLYAFLAIEDTDWTMTYQLVLLNRDAEIVQTIYEWQGDFLEGRGSQGARAIQLDNYIIVSTFFWSEDVLSFLWVYDTRTGESIQVN